MTSSFQCCGIRILLTVGQQIDANSKGGLYSKGTYCRVSTIQRNKSAHKYKHWHDAWISFDLFYANYHHAKLLIAWCLSTRLLILQSVFSVGGVWPLTSIPHRMQLSVWLVHKHSSYLGMHLKDPVYKNLCTLT